MNIMDRLKQLRDSYISRQAGKVTIPEFADSPVVRRHLLFCGRVQGVGFRFEVMCLAERLALTGWVKNLPGGQVEAELQGGADRIDFLVEYMRSLPRISIKSVESTDLPPDPAEKDFTIKM